MHIRGEPSWGGERGGGSGCDNTRKYGPLVTLALGQSIGQSAPGGSMTFLGIKHDWTDATRTFRLSNEYLSEACVLCASL